MQLTTLRVAADRPQTLARPMTLDAKQVGRTADVARRFATSGFVVMALLQTVFVAMFWSRNRVELDGALEAGLLAMFWTGTALATIGVMYAVVASVRRERGVRRAWLLGCAALVQPMISLLHPGVTQ